MNEKTKDQLKLIKKYFLAIALVIATISALISNIESINGFIMKRFFPGQDVDVMISLSDENKLAEPEYTSEIYTVNYTQNNSPDILEIEYSFAAEQPLPELGSLGEGPFFEIAAPIIDFKVVNNSEKSIFINELIIEVSETNPIIEPVMVLMDSRIFLGMIQVANDGWSEPTEVSLKLSLDADGPFVELPYSEKEFADINYYTFDPEEILSELGVSAKEIRDAQELDEIHPFDIEMCEKTLNFLGPVKAGYGDVHTCEVWPYGRAVSVFGTLCYSWNNSIENKTDSSNHCDEISTQIYITSEEGLGAGGLEPTGKYQLEIPIDNKPNVLRKNVSQVIPPGGFDRFEVSLGAKQSVDVLMSIKLSYNDGKILGPKEMRFKYWMPKSVKNHLDSNKENE